MELDPDQLQCDSGDARFAVAFGRWKWEQSAVAYAYSGPWAPHCHFCLERYQHDPGFFYVRFRADRDDLDGHDSATALKHGDLAADNNGP
jgi:hypothetical protein